LEVKDCMALMTSKFRTWGRSGWEGALKSFSATMTPSIVIQPDTQYGQIPRQLFNRDKIELGKDRLLTLEEGLVDGPSVLLGNKHFE
jgi:hypothetical protein